MKKLSILMGILFLGIDASAQHTEAARDTSKVLDEARDLVTKRLAELDDERKRLERALAELGGKAARKAGRRPGRPKGSTSTKSKAAKKGRRRKRRVEYGHICH